MNEQLIAALGTLALAAIGALTAWVRVAQLRIEHELKRNTKLTQQAGEAATQAAEQTGETVAHLRDRVQTLTALLSVYRDIVNYVKSTPEGKTIIEQFRERRLRIVHDADLEDLERRLLREARLAEHRDRPAGRARYDEDMA